MNQALLDYWRQRYAELSAAFWEEMRGHPLPLAESQANCYLRLAIFQRLLALERASAK